MRLNKETMLKNILPNCKSIVIPLISFFLLALAIPTRALATVSLQGYIADHDANPLPDVTVWTQYGSTTTDAGGYYSFSDLGTAQVAMKITKSGYITQWANINVTSGTTTDKGFTMPHIVFSDNFESNGFTNWTTNNNMTISTGTKQGGSYAAEGNATGSSAMNLRKTLDSSVNILYYRTYFNINSQDSSSGLGLLGLRTAADSAIIKVYVDGPTGKLCTRNEITVTNTCSSTVPSQDEWHSLELKVNIPGGLSSSEIKVWYDGEEVTSLYSASANLGTSAAGRITLGEVNSGRTYDVFFDDVVLAEGRVGLIKGLVQGSVLDADSLADVVGSTVTYDTTSYTTNGDTANFWIAGVPAGARVVTASWPNLYAPENHTYVISEETNYVHAYHLESTTGTAWGYVRDTSNNPINGATVTISGGSPLFGTTYTTGANGLYQFSYTQPGSYTVTASKSGYITKSGAVTVTAQQSSQTDLVLPTLIFSDNFETGNLNSWSPVNGMTAQTSNVHFGSYAAEGNTTAAVMNLRKHFATTYPEVYYRAHFNMKSMGSNNVGLLWVRTDADTAIMKTYIDGTTGKLCLRNDIASTSICSTTVPALDAWHYLEMHVLINGTSSTHHVWLDGVEVTDLTATSANLGTANVGRIYLGETSVGRTYHVLFDDVMVQTARVGAAGGSITGTVTDSANSLAPVSGATVSVSGTSTTTDGSGVYTLSDVAPGSYTVSVSKTGYTGNSGSATVVADTATTLNVSIAATYTGSITGTVYDAKTSSPLSGVTVTYSGGGTTTNGSGVYTLTGVPDGTYAVTASLEGYESKTESSVGVSGGGQATQNITVRKQFIADTFESNNFNIWTTNNNLTMQSTTTHGGSYAAEGNATGGAGTNLKKTLASAQGSVYFRTYFYINSQASGSGIGLVSYRDSSDSAIVKTYIDGTTGKLCMRNEVTTVNTCSNTVPSQDAWHSVELYADINGTSSTHKVFLNGTEETALTSTSANLGTNSIGHLVLGEINSGRTYDIFFDDVKALDVPVGL